MQKQAAENVKKRHEKLRAAIQRISQRDHTARARVAELKSRRPERLMFGGKKVLNDLASAWPFYRPDPIGATQGGSGSLRRMVAILV